MVTPEGVWSGAAGVDGVGTALQPDSALSIMSISKTFTAAEVMLLSTRGLIDLDGRDGPPGTGDAQRLPGFRGRGVPDDHRRRLDS